MAAVLQDKGAGNYTSIQDEDLSNNLCTHKLSIKAICLQIDWYGRIKHPFSMQAGMWDIADCIQNTGLSNHIVIHECACLIAPQTFVRCISANITSMKLSGLKFKVLDMFKGILSGSTPVHLSAKWITIDRPYEKYLIKVLGDETDNLLP